MKKATILKKISIALASVFAGLLISTATAKATAPCIPYTGPTTNASPIPAFNVFCGNIPAPAPAGSEANFFQGRAPVNGNLNDPSTPFTNPLDTACSNNEILQLHIYVHNGASVDNNNNGSGPSVAHGTKVAVALPSATAQATNFDTSATISANNAATVSDTLKINCGGQSVELQYIPGSASQFSNGSGVRQLSDAIVGSGVPIQSEQTPGDVWGCWNERVYVVLAVKVVIPVTPPPVTATCNLLTVVATADRKVTVNNFKFTAENASFKNAVLNWGDNNKVTVENSNSVIGQNHQYSGTGSASYEISALVDFSVPGQADITSGGPGTICSETVSFSPNQPPTVTPPTTTTVVTSTPSAPTQLVNTGAGSVVGIFAATTAAGAAAYRYLLGRRLSQR